MLGRILAASAVTAAALTPGPRPAVVAMAPAVAPIVTPAGSWGPRVNASAPASATAPATTTTTTTAPPASSSTAPPPPPSSPPAARRYAPPARRSTCPAAVAAMAAAGAPAATLTTWDAIAWRESRCQLAAHRHTGGDDSYCWWQIEYGHGLGAARTARYGPGAALLVNPAACARAALALYRAAGWAPWRTR